MTPSRYSHPSYQLRSPIPAPFCSHCGRSSSKAATPNTGAARRRSPPRCTAKKPRHYLALRLVTEGRRAAAGLEQLSRAGAERSHEQPKAPTLRAALHSGAAADAGTASRAQPTEGRRFSFLPGILLLGNGYVIPHGVQLLIHRNRGATGTLKAAPRKPFPHASLPRPRGAHTAQRCGTPRPGAQSAERKARSASSASPGPGSRRTDPARYR